MLLLRYYNSTTALKFAGCTFWYAFDGLLIKLPNLLSSFERILIVAQLSPACVIHLPCSIMASRGCRSSIVLVYLYKE